MGFGLSNARDRRVNVSHGDNVTEIEEKLVLGKFFDAANRDSSSEMDFLDCGTSNHTTCPSTELKAEVEFEIESRSGGGSEKSGKLSSSVTR